MVLAVRRLMFFKGRFCSTTPRKETHISNLRNTGPALSPDDVKAAIVATLDDNKAEDIVVIPLTGKSALADYMVIATGRSSRHVVSLAELVGDRLAKEGVSMRFEGKENGDWVLADARDVIVHIFRPEVREFYNIEKIWMDDPSAITRIPAQTGGAALTA